MITVEVYATSYDGDRDSNVTKVCVCVCVCVCNRMHEVVFVSCN
jgi:hypothetical protein